MDHVAHLWLIFFRSMNAEVDGQWMRSGQGVIVKLDPHRGSAADFDSGTRPYSVVAPDRCWQKVAVDFLQSRQHADVCHSARAGTQDWHDWKLVHKLT